MTNHKYQLFSSCIICKKHVSVQNLYRHYDTHFKIKPSPINECLHCGNLTHAKFCSHSCAATYTNKLKSPVSNMTKRKTSLTIKSKRKSKICESCNIEYYPIRKTKFCSDLCAKDKFTKPNRNYRYKCQFKFDVYSYPKEFDLTLIDNFGWYKPINYKLGKNLYGISKDHKFSVKSGEILKINSEILSHPANCELLPQSKNSSKNCNNSISILELCLKIITWNTKYQDTDLNILRQCKNIIANSGAG